MKENKESLIHIENLTKFFKKQEVLHNLSIDLNQGDRISLSGPNGAGKTTLLRCILGHYLHEGNLDVLGMNPRKQHQECMQQIGFVPQIPPPIEMTVKEMLGFFSKLSNTPQENFIEITHKLGLEIEENYSKPFYKLSGGMKQKLLIAFALGRKPKILLMDEPSANLDPKARDVLFDSLGKVDQNTLMILSSHRFNEVSKLANRFIEMDLGKVVEDRIN